MWGMASGNLVPKSPTHPAPNPRAYQSILADDLYSCSASDWPRLKKAVGETYHRTIKERDVRQPSLVRTITRCIMVRT